MTLPAALVTGAPGWLGARLVKAIATGLPDVPGLDEGSPDRPIRCLVRAGKDISGLEKIPGRIESVRGDLTDPDSLREFVKHAEGATLFHVAGVIHPGNRTRRLFEVNAEGTENLVRAAKNAGVRRMVHVSSNSPFGFNPDPQKPFNESSPYNPYMSYGKSKMLAEKIVAAEQGIETVIVRPPWFYGPGQPPRQSRFISMIKNGQAPVVGPGENLRSMAYVDNICQGLLLCEKIEAAKGHAYWIADRKPYSINQVIETVAEVLEKDFGLPVKKGQRKLPGFMGEIALWADKIIQGSGLYQMEIHVLSEMKRNIFCSIEKAEKELGFDPKIDLYEGMRRSVQWMLDNGIKP